MATKAHKFEIVNYTWKIWFLTPAEFAGACGSDSVAETDIESRMIRFNTDDCTIETIRHELVHAYVVMFNFVELDLDEDQTEEFYCELFGKYGEVICKQARKLFKLNQKKLRKAASKPLKRQRKQSVS